jgi:hypothetical protein
MIYGNLNALILISLCFTILILHCCKIFFSLLEAFDSLWSILVEKEILIWMRDLKIDNFM